MPNADQLMEDIACLRCALQDGDVPLLILGAVAGITGGGGGGGGGVSQGSGPPVAPPSNPTIAWVYTDLDDGVIYSWDINLQAWI